MCDDNKCLIKCFVKHSGTALLSNLIKRRNVEHNGRDSRGAIRIKLSKPGFVRSGSIKQNQNCSFFSGIFQCCNKEKTVLFDQKKKSNRYCHREWERERRDVNAVAKFIGTKIQKSKTVKSYQKKRQNSR